MSSLTFTIPDSIQNQLLKITNKENISMNQFISSAVSEKLTVFMSDEYILEREQKASKEKFLTALASVPNCETDEFDKY